jgi:hypothetical protein
VIPHHMTTKGRLVYQGVIGAGASSGGMWNMAINNFNPLIGPNSIGSLLTSVGNPTASTPSTLRCNGFSQMSALYQNYKVMTVDVSITWLPQTPTDTIILYGYPVSVDSTTIPVDLDSVASQRFSKVVTCTPAQQGKIRFRIDVAKFLGLSRAQYLGLASIPIGTPNPLASELLLVVGYKLATTSSVLAGFNCITVEIEQEILWSSPQTLTIV